MPDSSYLPKPEWREPLPDDYQPPAPGQGPQLNNGRPAPAHKAYFDRVKEMSTDNGIAFTTVRRLPTPPGQQSARLGNAYEFFKNLELISGFWRDTTLSGPEPHADDGDERPLHQRIQVRSGTGSGTPADFRQSLLASLVKFVAYDFACNVQRPRVEPRLFIGPSQSTDGQFPGTSPPTSFPCIIDFVYRTPNDRMSARSGIIEGPIAALRANHTTGFETTMEEVMDLAREVTCLLVTAQQRAREGKEEVKHDEKDPNKWWCFKKRWGGGSGGPIGKEEDRTPTTDGDSIEPSSAGIERSLAEAASQREESGLGSRPSALGALGARDNLDDIRTALAASGPLPTLTAGPSVPGRKLRGKGKTMSLYDNYRMVRPPSSSWDKKCRYIRIGAVDGAEYDDVFLVNCINHHVSISRSRVPKSLIDTIEGRQGKISEPMKVWRTKWFDLFKQDERIEAVTGLFGMMSWLLRVPQPSESPDPNPYGDVSVYSRANAQNDNEVKKGGMAEQVAGENKVDEEGDERMGGVTEEES